MAPTAFSIGVIIAITNPGVIVLVVMFTSFLARRKATLLQSEKVIKNIIRYVVFEALTIIIRDWYY